MPDFRASERVFSLVVQVAGRAGRYDPDGVVYIQTLRPDHPVMRLAAAMDVPGFHEQELRLRKALEFPPFARIARLLVRSKDRERCIAVARELARRARSMISPATELLGPAECPLGMIAGSQRWQIILRAASLNELHASVKTVLAGLKTPSSVYIEIDIDPVQLL
jgi:primosomal protein N' (replication factor Y)